MTVNNDSLTDRRPVCVSADEMLQTKSRVQHYLQLAMIESSVLVGSDQVGSGHRSKV